MNDQKNSRPAERGPSRVDIDPHTDHRVDLERFHPERYRADAILTPPGAGQRFHVLYFGPLRPEHGIELLADAFLAARDRDPRLQLVIVGGGSSEPYLRHRIGDAATFLGWLDEDRRAPIYAGADLLVLPAGTAGSGRAILEAQASGLPVLAVNAGAAPELIQPGRSGCLVAAEADTLAAAIRGLARRAALCERLAAGGLRAAHRRPQGPRVAPVGEGVARAA
jgi:glycosyltransferase involved in cell wall biosynthesis